MSSFSENGDFGADEVLVVVVVVDDEDEDELAAPSVSCTLGTTSNERIKTKARNDLDFMKTLGDARLRY